MLALLQGEETPKELQEALEVVSMLRAGLMRPWTWDEWLELSASFANDVLVTHAIVLEAQKAMAEAGQD